MGKHRIISQGGRLRMQSHYFIAVPLPEILKQQIKEYLAKDQQREALSFKRWVHQDDYHITLAFLGACSKEQLETIMKQGNELIRSWHTFTLALSEFGIFGHENKPRIFWLGVEEQPVLYRYREQLYQLCQSIGFNLDRKAFSPHITLARQWTGADSFQMEKLSFDINSRWVVNEMVLYKSVLTNEPKYHRVETFELNG